MELLDWSLTAFDCPVTGAFLYGESNSPEKWHCQYPDAWGCAQSPVNVLTREATVLAPSKSLKWRAYCDEPRAMSIVNDGNTVRLFGCWPCPASRPHLQGGPLAGVYEFHSAIFRWGPCDEEGSEHCLDYTRYALELQVVHAKPGLDTTVDVTSCKIADALAVVSFFFQVTSADNPYLDHVVTNLWRVESPGTASHISAFPLEWLFPVFKRKFYTYPGSLTQPPCSEIVAWIIQPEPIAISANQVSQFRKVRSIEGPILSNTRPVQKLNDREILYFS
ncbi:carbonic anhydrase 3-like [Phymastichus coffea]|uniref:carbonic anhydrase 3-like n=1 Tax=Phymastichus coffea TaxID=108790 RepID=UPI00273BFB8C|nr:carbonic anhydrase 3-like [Phymastichus coffea]